MAGTAPFRIKSMTGFGRGSAEAEGTRVEVEVRGVNHRYLDLKMRLPPELGPAEPDLRGVVQGVVGRGRLEVGFAVLATGSPICRAEVNRPLVREYLAAAAALKKEFRLRGSVALQSVLALPGAVAIRTNAAAPDGLVPRLASQALGQALLGYDAMRTEEGGRLAATLRECLRAIAGEVLTIEEQAGALPEAYARRLRERVGALVKEKGLDDLRLAQEVALLADRVDITEEMVRLKGYAEQAEMALVGPQAPVGKMLDFLMQEMNREANTISSKAELLPICQAALRVKSQVETIREQVQNLE